MRVPAKLQQLLELGHQVDELFETITDAFEALYGRRRELGRKEYKRQRDLLEKLADRLCDECTLSDNTKDVIAAIEGVEFDMEQTRSTLDQVREKWTAYQAKTKGTR